MVDCIIVGCGFAGAVMARKLAEDKNMNVLLIEKRKHVGGNMYDYYNKEGILVHKYGPHIFHTNHEDVFSFLSRFTKWNDYEHRVMGYIDGTLKPIPFNLNTLFNVFEQKEAIRIKELLIKKYGYGAKIPILKLQNHSEEELQTVAEYIYKKIFLNYTIKQWGLKPTEIDISVTSRVPIHISYDNRYFQDRFQGLPSSGYKVLFQKLLNHSNIQLRLSTDTKELLTVDVEKQQVFFKGTSFPGIVIYTGPIDALLNYSYGVLPYRSLKFKWETHNQEWNQPCGTVNYPNDFLFTRITEYKHLTGQSIKTKTSIVKEYPCKYNYKTNLPFYPILTADNLQLYSNYIEKLKNIKNIFLLGRLAEYKYYNMDEVIKAALRLFGRLESKGII